MRCVGFGSSPAFERIRASGAAIGWKRSIREKCKPGQHATSPLILRLKLPTWEMARGVIIFRVTNEQFYTFKLIMLAGHI